MIGRFKPCKAAYPRKARQRGLSFQLDTKAATVFEGPVGDVRDADCWTQSSGPLIANVDLMSSWKLNSLSDFGQG